MDKQRDIYRQLLVKLFEKNFTAALFVEKTDAMMKISDFEMIRNEIEEETFTKNRGIKPYIDAIKYLCKKIEKLTADNRLFEPIEDYICAKENIVVTKIEKGKTHLGLLIDLKVFTKKRNDERLRLSFVSILKLPAKPVKQIKNRKRATATADAAAVHAECNSPNPCKKCRFMRRLGKCYFRFHLSVP